MGVVQCNVRSSGSSSSDDQHKKKEKKVKRSKEKKAKKKKKKKDKDKEGRDKRRGSKKRRRSQSDEPRPVQLSEVSPEVPGAHCRPSLKGSRHTLQKQSCARRRRNLHLFQPPRAD
jgi:hypothetical protein